MSWCTIESDPGVFSELIELLKVPNINVEEIYSIDGMCDSVASQPFNNSTNLTVRNDLKYIPEKQAYGLIFLFKYVNTTDTRSPILFDYDVPELNTLFYAKQVVTDACATQAILSVLLNAPIELGPTLNEFKSFTTGFDYEMKGMAIGNSDSIRGISLFSIYVI